MHRHASIPPTAPIPQTHQSGGRSRLIRTIACVALMTAGLITAPADADVIGLAQLDLSNMPQEWGKPGVDRSVEGNPLSIGGKRFDTGVGSHAHGSVIVELDGKANRFTASVGVDDEVKEDPRARQSPIDFRVLVDGKLAFRSGPIKVGDPAKAIDVDLKGAKNLVLYVRPAAGSVHGAHANWAEAKIDYDGAKPATVKPAVEEKITLTPKAPATPRINGAKVVGVRPGRPLLYQIAATGQRPVKYAVENLPSGFVLDETTGVITGQVAQAGSHRVKVKATNALGTAEANLRIEVGDTIALTPPMGWNSWNAWGMAIDDAKVRAAADTFVNSGLTQHGWTYINIDDGWQKHRDDRDGMTGPGRDANGAIVPNPKFPDMKALTDYVHNRGLKVGIYSSPGPYTCGGCLGSFGHEALDAQTYASWGIDYLKYDWCSYQPRLEAERAKAAGTVGKVDVPSFTGGERVRGVDAFKKPYSLMHDELAKQNRDIVYSLCQYGMGDVWKWGGSVGGQAWRTTGDIEDTWSSMSSIGFSQAGKEQFAKPGNWNDPDMLVVGMVGWGPKLHATRLTPNEQYTHMSLWSLLASPLLIGCDLTQLDPFTLGLLTNDEVLAVNQDPLGKQAGRVVQNEDDTEIWAKDMEDGSKAVGLFNRSEVPMKVTVTWSQLGLTGKPAVRDLWRQQDVEASDDGYTVEVGRHGAALIKVAPAK